VTCIPLDYGSVVTNFTAGNLSPLFTTSVANPTTAPALTFSLNTAGAHTVFGNNTGSTGAPSFFVESGPLRGISFTVYNSGGLTAGTTAASYDLFTVPVACTISGYDLGIDSGTITVKFWKIAAGTAIPTATNSINTSGVSISSGTAKQSSTLTDFTTTTVSVHDIMAMDITAVSGASLVNGVLECQ
jgi:hypothetical protein